MFWNRPMAKPAPWSSLGPVRDKLPLFDSGSHCKPALLGNPVNRAPSPRPPFFGGASRNLVIRKICQFITTCLHEKLNWNSKIWRIQEFLIFIFSTSSSRILMNFEFSAKFRENFIWNVAKFDERSRWIIANFTSLLQKFEQKHENVRRNFADILSFEGYEGAI